MIIRKTNSNHNNIHDKELLVALMNRDMWALKKFLALYRGIFLEIIRKNGFHFDKIIERNIYKRFILKHQKQNYKNLQLFCDETSLTNYLHNLCAEYLFATNEEQLFLSALVRGEKKAWKTFLLKYGYIIQHYINKYANDFSEEDKRDIIQEFICYAHEKLLTAYQFKAKFTSYLSSAAYFFVMNWVKKRLKETKPGGVKVSYLVDNVLGAQIGKQVDVKLTMEKIVYALNFPNQVFLIMKFYHQRSVEEICLILGLKTRNAYDKRYFDIKAKMKYFVKHKRLHAQRKNLHPRAISKEKINFIAQQGIKDITLTDDEKEYFLRKGLFEVYTLWSNYTHYY